jgi:hypothetical protein
MTLVRQLIAFGQGLRAAPAMSVAAAKGCTADVEIEVEAGR